MRCHLIDLWHVLQLGVFNLALSSLSERNKVFSQRRGEDWRGLQALSFGAEVDMGAPTGPSAAELITLFHLKFRKKCYWGLCLPVDCFGS